MHPVDASEGSTKPQRRRVDELRARPRDPGIPTAFTGSFSHLLQVLLHLRLLSRDERHALRSDSPVVAETRQVREDVSASDAVQL